MISFTYFKKFICCVMLLNVTNCDASKFFNSLIYIAHLFCIQYNPINVCLKFVNEPNLVNIENEMMVNIGNKKHIGPIDYCGDTANFPSKILDVDTNTEYSFFACEERFNPANNIATGILFYGPDETIRNIKNPNSIAHDNNIIVITCKNFKQNSFTFHDDFTGKYSQKNQFLLNRELKSFADAWRAVEQNTNYLKRKCVTSVKIQDSTDRNNINAVTKNQQRTYHQPSSANKKSEIFGCPDILMRFSISAERESKENKGYTWGQPEYIRMYHTPISWINYLDDIDWSKNFDIDLDSLTFTQYELDFVFNHFNLFKYKSYQKFLVKIAEEHVSNYGERYWKELYKIVNVPRHNFSEDEEDFISENYQRCLCVKKEIEFNETAGSEIVNSYRKSLNKFCEIEAEKFAKRNITTSDLISNCLDNIKSSIRIDSKNIYFSRLKAFANFETDKNIYEKSYCITSISRDFLKSLTLDDQILEKCDGNIIQQNLHSECLNLIEESAYLFNNTKNGQIKNIAQLAVIQAHEACQLNANKKTSFGYYLCDVAHCVLAFGKGVMNATKNNVEAIVNLLINPIGTALSLAKNVIMATSKYVSICYRYNHGTEDEKEKAFQEIYDFTGKIVTDIKRRVSSSEEASENIGYLVADYIFLPKCRKKLLSEMPNISNLKHNSIFSKLGSEIGNEAAKLTGLIAQKGPHYYERGLEFSKKFPEFRNYSKISESIRRAADWSLVLDHYLDNLIDSYKKILTDSKYRRRFIGKFESGLSPLYIPPSKLRCLEHSLYYGKNPRVSYVDYMNNRWIKNTNTNKFEALDLYRCGQRLFGMDDIYELKNVTDPERLIRRLGLQKSTNTIRKVANSQKLTEAEQKIVNIILENSPNEEIIKKLADHNFHKPTNSNTIKQNKPISKIPIKRDYKQDIEKVIKDKNDSYIGIMDRKKKISQVNENLKFAENMFHEIVKKCGVEHLVVEIKDNNGRYKGSYVKLPGTEDAITFRPISLSSPPTIDISVYGLGIRKLKFIGK